MLFASLKGKEKYNLFSFYTLNLPVTPVAVGFLCLGMGMELGSCQPPSTSQDDQTAEELTHLQYQEALLSSAGKKDVPSLLESQLRTLMETW